MVHSAQLWRNLTYLSGEFVCSAIGDSTTDVTFGENPVHDPVPVLLTGDLTGITKRIPLASQGTAHALYGIHEFRSYVHCAVVIPGRLLHLPSNPHSECMSNTAYA